MTEEKCPPACSRYLQRQPIRKKRRICSRSLASNLQFLLRAAGGKAFAAQNRSSARRLEGYVIGFAALIAGDFETLAFAAARSPSAASEIGATAIAASLATLRLAQVSFRVILLLAFGKWKRRAALGASDLYVWHFSFSLRKAMREDLRLSSLSKGLALVCFNPFFDCDRHRARTIKQLLLANSGAVFRAPKPFKASRSLPHGSLGVQK